MFGISFTKVLQYSLLCNTITVNFTISSTHISTLHVKDFNRKDLLFVICDKKSRLFEINSLL